MRARQPDQTGFVERDGVPLYWEVHGNGDPSFLLLPTWSIIHSRVWKMQVPYLARHARVVTFDGRGNGRSGRPQATTAYLPSEFAQDALAVMDATGTEDAIMVGFSAGAQWLLELLRTTPAKVKGAVFIGPALPF
ncbi:MAG: alpha/beta hydrolase, partial [Trueperaceae bacterium]